MDGKGKPEHCRWSDRCQIHVEILPIVEKIISDVIKARHVWKTSLNHSANAPGHAWNGRDEEGRGEKG